MFDVARVRRADRPSKAFYQQFSLTFEAAVSIINQTY
jgi:hypothetical protein